MDKPDRDRIQEIFCAALEKPPSERKEFVEKACDSDPNLFREVISLLNAHESDSGILGSPIFPAGHDPDAPARKISGRYIVERRLAKGGMGEVYLALDSRVNCRPVVLKVLAEELRDDSRARQKFHLEARALSQIRHDGVVDVLDIGEWIDGRPYFVMPYLQGEMLRSQIPPHGMNLERAAAILKQIGAALDDVHEHSIFHRDLKPENIMLKPESDSPVLIDFGIARVNTDLAPPTATGVSPGTLPYMSPEQLCGGDITATSDVYAMAVVAYEMITGRRPFNPESMAHLLDLQRAGVKAKPVDLRPGLSKKAQAIIFRGLSFKPKDRYQNAKQFGDDLAAALLDVQTPHVTEPPPPPLWRRIAVITGILVAVSLVSYVIYPYIIEPDPPLPGKGVNYYLMVQRTRNGKDYEQPYKSNGKDDTFEAGDKYQLNVSSLDEPGYLYIFADEGPETNNPSFRQIFPTKAINDGSATIGANQTVQSEWMTFRGPPGAENFWLVWSASPVTQLETAKSGALAHPLAGLTDQSLIAVKEFLKQQPRAAIRRYRDRKEATVRARSDLVVTLVQFEHR